MASSLARGPLSDKRHYVILPGRATPYRVSSQPASQCSAGNVHAMSAEQFAPSVTPRELAAELAVSDKTIRQWLRDQGWQSVPHTRWRLTPERANQVRRVFGSRS